MKIYSWTPYIDQFGYDDYRPEFNGEYNLISYLIKPGAIVFDVGANVGLWSEHALFSCPIINLRAFEPVPELYCILSQRLRKFDKVETYNMAIAQQNGYRTFYYYNRNIETSGLSSFYRRPIPEVQQDMKPRQIDVKTEALDTFCDIRHISRIDFLKIDTEGGELEVLKGADGLLKQKRIIGLQFEYGGTYLDAKITLRQVLEFLWQWGYNVFRILPDGLLQISRWNDSLETFRYSNYLASIPYSISEF
jgi:FkbM family methyltransferase